MNTSPRCRDRIGADRCHDRSAARTDRGRRWPSSKPEPQQNRPDACRPTPSDAAAKRSRRSARRYCSRRAAVRWSAGTGYSSSGRSTGGSCSTTENGAGGPERGSLPEALVQEHRAGVRLVGAGPLDALRCLQPRVAHAAEHRGRHRPHFVPRPVRPCSRASRPPRRRASSHRTGISSRASPGGSRPCGCAARAVRCW